jgi:SAM-dependent methyltransferase
LYTQRFSELSDGALLRGYDVVTCNYCGFGFADGIPSQAEFDAYYRDMSKYEHQERGGTEPPGDLARLEKMAAIIQRAAAAPALRILDVGCSTGGLLAMLARDGYQNVRGLDPSPACAAAARRLYDIEVITASLGDFDPAPESFDLVILSAVLEHIRDLQPALEHVRRMLSEQGCLFISVPDAGRFSEDDEAPFQQFSIEHINFFSPISLRNLLQRAGFEQILSEENCYGAAGGGGTMTPVVDALFRRADVSDARLVPDEVTPSDLEAYIRKSRAIDDRIRTMIDRILDDGSSIIVWGAGTHTRRLLATSRLADAPIVAFVDSNPRYQGKQLNGVPILAPQELRDRSEPILISSRTFQREIEQQIRETLGLANALYLLYE